MDHNLFRGHGISNFSSSSPHRLPTVSAAQALQNLESSPTRCISTGLKDLDAILQSRDPLMISDGESFHGGVSRGKVTEIWGPPGVGKTALGMQLAASALHTGDGVVWVDASHPLPGPRFSQILASFKPVTPSSANVSSSPKQSRSLPELLENLIHFSTPTLAHLIALFSQETPTHPPQKTSLIIVDSFSTLISNAFPRSHDANATPRKPGAPKPSARKFPILQHLINSLQKLAATRNIAIVILSQCVTKMRVGAGAVLVPAVDTTSWEQGLACRVALFRDWGWNDVEGNQVSDVRIAQVVKAEGTAVPGVLVAFSVGETGLLPLIPPTSSMHPLALYEESPPHQRQNQIQESPSLPQLLPQKRKLSATDLEIPDSEGEDDEDYGWAEEDEEEIPAMPPQWQGSEDILVPAPGELEGEEEALEDEQGRDDECVGGGETGMIKKMVEEVGDSEDELAL